MSESSESGDEEDEEEEGERGGSSPGTSKESSNEERLEYTSGTVYMCTISRDTCVYISVKIYPYSLLPLCLQRMNLGI